MSTKLRSYYFSSHIIWQRALYRGGAQENEGNTFPLGSCTLFQNNSSDSLFYLRRIIRMKLWVPTLWTSKPISTSVSYFFFS